MSKITEISQFVVIGLLFMGAMLFLFQSHYLKFSVYMGFVVLFLGFSLLEKKILKSAN